MPRPEVEIADVIIDCSDPGRLAAFWADLLGRPVEASKGPYVWLTRPEGAVGVSFQRVESPKVGKNRVHIDISGPDLVEIKRRVEALGGRRLPGYETGGFLVMADPEGNEFCVVPLTPVDADEEGRTQYLDGLDL